MSEIEYIIAVYCAVFKCEEYNAEICLSDFKNLIDMLPEQEQQALRYRYHDKMSYEDIQQRLCDEEDAHQIIDKVCQQLYSLAKQYCVSVSKLKDELYCVQQCLQEKDKTIEEKDTLIETLYNEIARLLNGKSVSTETLYKLYGAKIEIKNMGFTGRVSNALIRAGIHTQNDLFEINNFNEFTRISNIGRIGILQIIKKMQEYGHFEWVNNAISNTKGSLKEFLKGEIDE